MKLRRKLAALLICALVAGSMPTVSFAAPLEESVESEYSEDEGEAADSADSEEADSGDDKGSEESEEAADAEDGENSESGEAADTGEGEDSDEDAAEDAQESDESDEAEDSEEAEESGGTEDAENSDEAAETEDSEGSEDEAETKESDSTEEGKASEDTVVTDETSGTEESAEKEETSGTKESSETEEETSDTVDETDDSVDGELADDVTESSTETTVEEEYDLASDADADMELEYDLEVGIMTMALAVEEGDLITDVQKETLETLIKEGKALVAQDESLTDLAACIEDAEALLENEEATSEEAEALINSLTELIEAANTSAALSGSAYVLMNIPYAEFYEAELNNDVEVDGFTSATLNKTRTWSLSGGSYHINEDGSDITGITYPVYVEDLADLTGCVQVTDDDSVTITTTNRGQTSENTYTGKQALYENESYAYYVLGDDEEPDSYKVLTVTNGTFSFGKVQGEVEEVDASAEITAESKYGDYQITVDGIADYVTAGTDDVYAVILGTEEGNSYGLRHVENVWRVSNLAFCTGFTTMIHNCPTSSEHYEAIMGQTIDSITYYTSKGNYTFDVELYVPEKFEYELTVEDAVVSDGQTTFTLTGLPDGYEAKYSVEGLIIRVEDGIITFDSDAEAGNYTLVVSDASGVYADISASFSLTEVPYYIIDGVEVITDALYNENGSIDLTNTELFSEGADGAYLVTVGGVTQLVGDTSLKKWVGSYENWQSWIYPSEELLEQYPYLEEAWDLAYEAYIAAFEAYGMGDYIKALYPNTDSLKAYWYGMTDTYGVEYMEVEETADGGYVLSWLDADGNVLASDSYTMTGKVLNGLEGAIMYVFTADNLDEGSGYKYWVTMEPDMEGTTEFPIAAHFHFQYGSDIESLLVYGQLYNDTTKNIADRTWYATMIDADADALAKYNVILGMHMAEKWSELPEEEEPDDGGSEDESSSSADGGGSMDDSGSTDDSDSTDTSGTGGSSSSSGRPASSNATSHGSSSGGSGSSSSASSGSTWVQDVENDDNTWWLRRTDGSYVAGSVTTDENGNAHEQIAWAQVNGAWYAFGSDGYADQGWVLDYASGKWYFIDINTGMKSGWHHDDQDNYWYYLDPSSGAMRIGWNQIDGNWYYFNSNPLTYTWNYDESTGKWVYDTSSVSKPLGAMYVGETTPDGYAVDENGTWIQ